MKSIITKVSANNQGVSLELSERAQLNGRGLSAKKWFVSWDEIGRALFQEQYTDATTVKELDDERSKGVRIMNRIRVYHWSQCSEEWQFYCYVNSEAEYTKLVIEKGCDPRYFKLESEL